MHHIRSNFRVVLWLAVAISVTIMIPRIMRTEARANAQTQKGGQAKSDAGDSVFHEYKGVGLGMKADEARKKLGSPQEKDDDQDFYVFSETESAQVYYDKAKTVVALSVNFVGEGNGVPKPRAVLGEDVQAKPDGSMHQLIRFPKAGYWVSYSRTAGDSPLVTITFQKIQ